MTVQNVRLRMKPFFQKMGGYKNAPRKKILELER